MPPMDFFNLEASLTLHVRQDIHSSIGTILCAERWCCLSLLGNWAQSWMGRHWRWYSFCQPQKDDRLSQPHLVLIQQPSGIWTQDQRIPSPPPQPLSQHQAYWPPPVLNCCDWLFQNKISCSCRFPLLDSAFHSKDWTMRPKGFQKTSGIKFWKGTDQGMRKKYFKGLEYPLEHSQDNH